MKKNEDFFKTRKVLISGSFSVLLVSLLAMPQSVSFAVLKAEGGKEVIIADPLKEQGTPPEPSKPVGYTSRVPKSTRMPQSTNESGGAAQQQSAAAGSYVISYDTAKGTSEAAALAEPSSPQSLVINVPMKPTTVSPPMESFAGPEQSGAGSDLSSTSSDGFLGCILAGNLVRDVSLDVCNSKGGRPLFSSEATTAPVTQNALSPEPEPGVEASPS
ncbi:MAG: hypothetical protein KTQ49_01830 [Candidatus Omnitrophica bacterium]|nr:hypothetical protein [Candidatus Omnitrophota bacterium]